MKCRLQAVRERLSRSMCHEADCSAFNANLWRVRCVYKNLRPREALKMQDCHVEGMAVRDTHIKTRIAVDTTGHIGARRKLLLLKLSGMMELSPPRSSATERVVWSSPACKVSSEPDDIIATEVTITIQVRTCGLPRWNWKRWIVHDEAIVVINVVLIDRSRAVNVARCTRRRRWWCRRR